MADQAEKSDAQPAANASSGGWFRAHRTKVLILAGVVISLVGGGMAAWALFGRRGSGVVTAEAVLAALDAADYDQALTLADRFAEIPKPPAKLAWVVPYVRGAVAAYRSERSTSSNRREFFRKAADDLTEARRQGWPPSRAPEGLYLLGMSYVECDRMAAAREALGEALELNPERQYQTHRLLAAALLGSPDPKVAEALRENAAAATAADLSPQEKQLLDVQRAEILLAGNKPTEARKLLEGIARGSRYEVQAHLLGIRAMLQESQEIVRDAEASAADHAAAKKRIEDVIKALREIQAANNGASDVVRNAMLLQAISYSEIGQTEAAIAQFARVRRGFPETREAQAATFEEADLLRRQGHAAEALPHYRAILRGIRSPDDYWNPWLPLNSLRSRTLQAARSYLDQGDFAGCVRLASSLAPLFTEQRKLEIIAEAQVAWGNSLLRQAETEPPSKARATQREGREKLRMAGMSFAALAKIMITERRYTEDLWNALQAYREGHDYSHAVEIINEYLRNELRKRRPEALTLLGECHLSLGNPAAALIPLNDCIQNHNSATPTFRARLLAARALVEQGETDKAERMLRENLAAELLTPASVEWRESLMDLGQLLHQARKYDDAIGRLEEATSRYPDAPRTPVMLYLLADCHRQTARTIRDGLQKVLVESTRIARARQSIKSFDAALKTFSRARDAIETRQEKSELSSLDSKTLRNAYFGIAESLFDLGRYDEAIKAYTLAINRLHNAPEAVDGYVQIAAAQRALGRAAEARLALEQARLALGRIKPDVDLTVTTNFNRAQWEALLNRLGSL